MPGFVVRMLITALGLWVASAIVPGMEIRGIGTLLGSAVLLGVVNAVVRPLIVLLTLPITILTLGVFLLVINAAMLGLVASLFVGFAIHGFWAAVFGSVIVSLVSWFASSCIGPRGRFEIMIVRR
jgi:putative membrane protein